jgi:branched-chain amino acid transport system ATP-binding protein
MSLLEVRQLSMRFGGVQALESVSFTVGEGKIVGLMGANGAGKTTLFSLIAGNVRPSSGEVLFEDRSLAGLRPDQVCRRGVARTFQVVRPFAGLTVIENVTTAALFGMRRYRDRTQARDAAAAVLRELDLGDRADVLAGSLTLSGQKRLEVARALATGARLVLLDEVMAGLTPVEIEAMLISLKMLRRTRGLTLVVIEHVMRALMQLSDEILVLHSGRLIAQGEPQAVASDPEVLRLYFGEAA